MSIYFQKAKEMEFVEEILSFLATMVKNDNVMLLLV